MPSEAGHRLYVKGRHLSYQRGKRNTYPDVSLIKIEGVDDTKAATFYLGKKVAFVYRAKKEVRGTKIRVIWGKITRPHGMGKHCAVKAAGWYTDEVNIVEDDGRWWEIYTINGYTVTGV